MMNPVVSNTNPAAIGAGLRPAGIRAEFLDFRDRSRGLLHPSEIRGEIDRGRFVWLDIDVAEVEADLIETTLPPQACPGVNFRQLVDDHTTLRSPPAASSMLRVTYRSDAVDVDRGQFVGRGLTDVAIVMNLHELGPGNP